jgi:hypothetical protein
MIFDENVKSRINPLQYISSINAFIIENNIKIINDKTEFIM